MIKNNKLEKLKSEIKEQNEFLKDLKKSFDDIKHGRIQKHKFKFK